MNFEGYQYVALVAVLAECFVIAFTYNRKPNVAVACIILSIALKGQYIWVGRPIYAWQLVSVFALLHLVFKGGTTVPRAGISFSTFRLAMLFFFLYSVFISIPLWYILSVEGHGDKATAVSFSRIASQTVYLCFLLGLFTLGIRAGRHITTFDMLRTVISVSTFIAYGAIFQVTVLYLTGINLFPIIGSDETIRSAYIMDLVFRATSFAGEPKHLGLIMAFGLTCHFLMRLFRIPMGRQFAFRSSAAMVAALVLSLSATGIFLTALTIGFLALIFFRLLRYSDYAIAGFVLAISVTQILGSDGIFSSTLQAQASKTEFEVQDQSVSRALSENPEFLVFGSGLGNIHLFAVEHLPSNFPLFRESGYKANSGLFYVLGDSGLIGLLFLTIGPFLALNGYLVVRNKLPLAYRREAAITLAFIFASLLSFLLRFDVIYFMLSGFAYARLGILNKCQSAPRL